MTVLRSSDVDIVRDHPETAGQRNSILTEQCLQESSIRPHVKAQSRFRPSDEVMQVYFPLWYPALVFALAGVGVIRFRRQFSIRSALIAFAVVAALLAMPLAL